MGVVEHVVATLSTAAEEGAIERKTRARPHAVNSGHSSEYDRGHDSACR